MLDVLERVKAPTACKRNRGRRTGRPATVRSGADRPAVASRALALPVAHPDAEQPAPDAIHQARDAARKEAQEQDQDHAVEQRCAESLQRAPVIPTTRKMY